MNILYLVLGGALITLAVVDVLWTALWADGAAGPFSSRFTALLWRGLRRTGGPQSRSLSLAGPLILTATLFAWVAMLWIGWTLVFAAGPDALIDTRNAGPVSWVERQYFVAYSMFTMGNGDFSPSDGWPQIATSLTTASGMLFVTMGVSYVLSVLGAVNQKRAFAGSVWGMGTRGEDLVVTGWDGEGLRQLDLSLNSLASQLSLLADQHKAYPVLHYYHSEEPKNASAMAVAILDEALTLMLAGLRRESDVNRAVLGNIRSSVGTYLGTLRSVYVRPAEEVPPAPDLDRLRDAGIPTVSDEVFAARLEEMEERRRLLLAVVRADAWWWPSTGERPQS